MSSQRTFTPTYANLKEPGDTESVNKAIDIVYNNLNQLSTNTSVPLIEPLTAQVSTDILYNTIPKNIGMYKIMILSKYLVASTGGPFTLTLGTGSGTTILIPIAAAPATPRDLLFDIYVDSLGNIISSYWQV